MDTNFSIELKQISIKLFLWHSFISFFQIDAKAFEGLEKSLTILILSDCQLTEIPSKRYRSSTIWNSFTSREITFSTLNQSPFQNSRSWKSYTYLRTKSRHWTQWHSTASANSTFSSWVRTSYILLKQRLSLLSTDSRIWIFQEIHCKLCILTHFLASRIWNGWNSIRISSENWRKTLFVACRSWEI